MTSGWFQRQFSRVLIRMPGPGLQIAVLLEPLRHLQRAVTNLGVSGGVDRAFDRTGDNPAIAVKFCGVIDDAMAQQRPILHQPEHGVPSRNIASWTGAPAGRPRVKLTRIEELLSAVEQLS